MGERLIVSPGQPSLPGVDLAALAGLLAPLVAHRVDPQVHAERVAAEVVAALQPSLDRVLAAAERIEADARLAIQLADEARRERRSLGPFVPPPATSTN